MKDKIFDHFYENNVYCLRYILLIHCFCVILECIHLLLAHGAPVRVKNIQGWTPLAEAISYGDRQTSKTVINKQKLKGNNCFSTSPFYIFQGMFSKLYFHIET